MPANDLIESIDRMEEAIKSLGDACGLSQKEISGLQSMARGFLEGAIEQHLKLSAQDIDRAWFRTAVQAALDMVTDRLKAEGKVTFKTVDGSTQHG